MQRQVAACTVAHTTSNMARVTVNIAAGFADVLFTVVDFNDCPPVFVNPSPVMAVPENAAINSVVQTYSVQDCDSGLNGVNGTRFSIIAGENTV